MPIKVKYDGDISALAQLALATGAANLPRSRTPAPIGRGGGGGGGGGRRGGAGRGARGGRAGLTQEIAGYHALLAREAEPSLEEQLEFDLQRQQEMDELEEQKFERRWGLAEKKEMREYNRGIAWLEGPDAEDMEEGEKRGLIQMLRQKRLGIREGLRPRDPKWFDGLQDDQGNPVEPGVPWQGQDGGTYTWGQNATTGEKELKQVTSPDKSLEYLREKAEDVRMEKRTALAAKLFGEPLPVKDASGEDTGNTIPRSFEAAMRAASDFYPTAEERAQRAAPTISAEEIDVRQQQIEAFKAEEIAQEEALENPRDLIGWSKAMVDKLTEAENKLPGFEGMARAFMRAVRRRQKSGQGIPPEMTPAIQQALAIMERAKRNATD